MAILRQPTSKRTRLPKPPRIDTGAAGGAASSGAVSRRAQRFTSTPTPKPPPVVVPNNKGNFSRPKPPPPVQPGPIQGGGGGNNNRPGAGGGGGNRNQGGGRNRGKNRNRGGNLVLETPTEAPIPQPPIQQNVPQPPAPVEPGPIPMNIDQWLGTDTDYQGFLGENTNALTQFKSQQELARQQAGQSFAQRLRDLQQSQALDETDLQEDFASRGMSSSGVYADALAQLQQQYLQSQTNLQQEQTGFGSELEQQLAAFQQQQQAAIEQARLDAIARRAAAYGL